MNKPIKPDGRDDRALDSAEDRRLAALLAAVESTPNPAVWARVRTRLVAEVAPGRSVAGTRLDGFLDWLTRPAAMATATATLVIALGAGWTVIGSLSAEWSATSSSSSSGEELVATDATNLMESLLETNGEELDGADTPAAGEVDDSAAPGDSGGRS